jgi:hypothetical protein
MKFDETERLARRFTEICYSPQLQVQDTYRPTKENARAVAEACGVNSPLLYAEFRDTRDINFSALPDRFVLKPNNLASARGVHLLVKRGDMYFDLMSRKVLSEDDIRLRIDHHLSKKKTTKGRSKIFAEELDVGENGSDQIPFDYKMYTFDGQVELIAQTNRNTKPTSLAFFGHGFAPLDEHCIVRRFDVTSGEHVRPSNWQEMLDVARRVSEHLGLPFLRIDTFADGRRVVVGELTPRPGGPYFGMYRFSAELDAELGTHFRLALRRRGLPSPTVVGRPPGGHLSLRWRTRLALKGVKQRLLSWGR